MGIGDITFILTELDAEYTPCHITPFSIGENVPRIVKYLNNTGDKFRRENDYKTLRTHNAKEYKHSILTRVAKLSKNEWLFVDLFDDYYYKINTMFIEWFNDKVVDDHQNRLLLVTKNLNQITGIIESNMKNLKKWIMKERYNFNFKLLLHNPLPKSVKSDLWYKNLNDLKYGPKSSWQERKYLTTWIH